MIMFRSLQKHAVFIALGSVVMLVCLGTGFFLASHDGDLHGVHHWASDHALTLLMLRMGVYGVVFLACEQRVRALAKKSGVLKEQTQALGVRCRSNVIYFAVFYELIVVHKLVSIVIGVFQ